MKNSAKPETIDGYIKTFPKEVQTILKKVRQTIQKTVPNATETISYQMPTFKLNGTYLIYFGGWKNHIGIYPTPSGASAFKKELSQYESGKGSVKFPLDKPIPYGLIGKIAKFRAKESEKNKKA